MPSLLTGKYWLRIVVTGPCANIIIVLGILEAPPDESVVLGVVSFFDSKRWEDIITMMVPSPRRFESMGAASRIQS